MSPASVSSFVHDLVTMAQATEQLPQLQAECERLRLEVASYAETVQRLELKLLARNDDIDGLNSRIRSLEVERDDAGFRQLEAEDKIDAVRSIVENIQSEAEALKGKLFPKPIELKPEPMPIKDAEPVELPKASDWIPSQGQSEVDPTAPSTDTSKSETASTSSVPTTETASTESSKGVYADRYYIDHPGWVSREDWKAGGGSDASYDYRHDVPSNPRSF